MIDPFNELIKQRRSINTALIIEFEGFLHYCKQKDATLFCIFAKRA